VDSTEKYYKRVREKAAEIGADGCTMATGAFRDCCLEHDLFYRTGKTLQGKPITRAEADERFKSCMQRNSKLGWFSPMAWLRFFAVRKFGADSWKGEK
jgi:hypothetical protein